MPNPSEEKLAAFVADEILFAAVKAILLEQFDLNLEVADTMSDEQIAELVSARVRGRKLLKQGFRQIENYKRDNATGSLINNFV